MADVKVCRNGLHEKDYPGRCKPCRAAANARAYARYAASEKGRSRSKRYEASEERRVAKARWDASEKGRAAKAHYRSTAGFFLSQIRHTANQRGNR